MPERGSKTSKVPFVWATFGILSLGAIQKISCRDCWPRKKSGCITMIWRRGNNQWSGGIADNPAPKNSECKNQLENFSHRFFGSKRHPHHWLSSKGPNFNAEYYSSLLVQLKDILKEKRAGTSSTKGVFFLHDNAPAHRVHATQKKMAYLGFQCLDHPPYFPDRSPSVYQLFPWLK